MAACRNDSKDNGIEESQLAGRWELIEGMRNGRLTETMTGTFYEFNAEGKMRTNLTPSGIEEEFDYDLSGKQIEQKSEPEVIYNIESLNDSILEVSMSIRNIPFRLKLGKGHSQ
jgi:hypothetical protein